ncbi:MAG: cysteine desulfurase, partial [Planctomycetota bacterium]|nr:cysteine desulfurase [Planctomycetota bacterium]
MRVYFDHNATAPVSEEVADFVKEILVRSFGNPHSLHQFGSDARRLVEEARERMANFIEAESPSEIVFTSGGTEADNLALIGGAKVMRRKKGRDEVVTTSIEHPAVLATCRYLESEGFKVKYVKPQKNGIVSVESFREVVTERTGVVSLMLANNETGMIQPVAAIAEIVHERGALMHTDAVQGAGKIPVSVKDLEVDMLSLSGHKFGSPKGVGVLYIRRGVKIEPLFYGGGQEQGLRPSTLNVAGIAGMGLAAEIAKRNLSENSKKMRLLRDKLEESIKERIEKTYINGAKEPRLPNTSNISFEFVEGEALLVDLDT